MSGLGNCKTCGNILVSFDYEIKAAGKTYELECPECGEPLSLDIKKWGGRREGAGRKPSGKCKRTFYITDNEYEKLKKYLEELRI